MANKEQSSDEKVKEIIRKLDKKALGISLIGLIVLFAFPIWITDHFWFDYSKTGTLGDTIGGLTAPIIGFFSALLIYLSFRAQIKANYIVQGQIEKQEEAENAKKEIEFINKLYLQLKDEIDDFTYHENRGLGSNKVRYELKGAIAILSYLRAMDSNSETLNADDNFGYLFKSNYSLQYLGLLKLSNKLIDRIIDSKGKGHDNEFISTQIEYMFQFKLTYNHGISIDECENCGMRHNFLPCELYKLIYDLGLRIESLQVNVK